MLYRIAVETLVHATCVALGDTCALLRGPCGAGKSDLALRFLFLPADRLSARPTLIADDQVILRRTGGRIIASCPAPLAGKIEVRGLGIARFPFATERAELKLVADLEAGRGRPRFPECDQSETFLDLPIRRIVLDPFELSAPMKLALAMQNFFGEAVD